MAFEPVNPNINEIEEDADEDYSEKFAAID